MGPLRFEPWHDAVIDTVGHHATSDYVETYWLPVIGPSSLLIARRVARDIALNDTPVIYPEDFLGRCLGLAPAQFHRTLVRLVQFDLIQELTVDEYRIRCTFPPLARRHLARLPEALAAAHEAEQRRALGAA